jgi:hypothetical protein
MPFIYTDIDLTNESPLKFFIEFFEKGYLDDLRKSFFPDGNEEDSVNRFPTSIDKVNESYTYDYEVEESGYEENGEWVVDTYKWKTSKVFRFVDSLNVLMDHEASKAEANFESLILKATTQGNATVLCIAWTDRIRLLLEESKGLFKRYPICESCLIRLHGFLLRCFPTFCRDIVPLQPGKKIVREAPELDNKIFDALAHLNLKGNYFLIFNTDDDKQVVNTIRSIATGLISPENKPIVSSWQKQRIAYIIYKIRDHYESFDFRKFVDSKLLLWVNPTGQNVPAFEKVALLHTSYSKIVVKSSEAPFRSFVDGVFAKYAIKPQ